MGCCNITITMGCCDNRENELDIPDGVETYCHIQGRRCLCLPYDDAIVITSQIMATVALLFSLTWWVTFVISIIGMILIQLLWCCRQNKHSIYTSTAVAGVNSLVSLGFGIYYISLYWWYDYTGISILLCGVHWFAVAVCMVWFVKSGRHAKWEAHYSRSTAETNDDADPDALELESVPSAIPPTIEAMVKLDATD